MKEYQKEYHKKYREAKKLNHKKSNMIIKTCSLILTKLP